MPKPRRQSVRAARRKPRCPSGGPVVAAARAGRDERRRRGGVFEKGNERCAQVLERANEPAPRLRHRDAEGLRRLGHGQPRDSRQKERGALGGRQRADRRAHKRRPPRRGFSQLRRANLEDVAFRLLLDELRGDPPQEGGKWKFGRIAGRGGHETCERRESGLRGGGRLARPFKKCVDGLTPSRHEARESCAVTGGHEQKITRVRGELGSAPGGCHRHDSARARGPGGRYSVFFRNRERKKFWTASSPFRVSAAISPCARI